MNAVDEPPYGELASSFAGIARTLFSAQTVLATLQQIVDFAFATVEGSDVACISLRTADSVFTPAYSAPLAFEIDQLQYAAREGPCLDAISKEPTVYAEDLAEDQRWPVFGPQAAAHRTGAFGTSGFFADLARMRSRSTSRRAAW